VDCDTINIVGGPGVIEMPLINDLVVVLTRLGLQWFPTRADVQHQLTNALELVDVCYEAELREMVREKYDVDFRTFEY
jgi:hypothetical protein